MNNAPMQFVTLALIGLLLGLSANAATPLEKAVDTRLSGQQEAIDSQKKIDDISDQTVSLSQEYRQVLNQTESLAAYNNQLAKLVTNQQEEISSFNRQLNNIRIIQQKIVPFMLRMITVLEEFISLDVPFLPDERQARIAHLEEIMDSHDLRLPEKYRRITEAYQIEMDYGRTIEAYNGILENQGNSRSVNFLRIGRAGLYYLTFDGAEAGYWDKTTSQWKELSAEFNLGISKGLQIARKEAPPDLIQLPISKPEIYK